MSNLIVMTAEAAFKAHEDGKLTKEQLVEILQKCINATAMTNGYAEQNGLPFPEYDLKETK